jgi:HEAT repeat protein
MRVGWHVTSWGRRTGPLKGLLMLLAAMWMTTANQMPGEAALPQDEAAEARSLLDRFRAIDWNVRAAMSKQPTRDDTAWKTRLEVEHRLATLGPQAVPALRQSLDDSNRHVRALAAYVLGVRGEKKAAGKLRAVVSGDKDATVRLYAAEALGRIGDRMALPLLEEAGKSEPNPNVRYAAEQAALRLNSAIGTDNPLLKMARAFDLRQMALACVGKPAPDFTLETDAGKTVKLSGFRGRKPVVLLFQLADW